MRYVQPLANGISTDHPIPGLPFVDDAHLPLEDPREIEAIGRHPGGETWGRWDGELRFQDTVPGQWWAFTTDPERHDVAWCVRFHPDHGRTVILVEDSDASVLHMDWADEVQLLRAGGYWWDGQHWYRPNLVFDAAREQFVHYKVKGAHTITAADLLDEHADPARASLLAVADIGPDAKPVGDWADQLALWASRRDGDARALDRCVVNISAPELAVEQLLSASELAQLAGIEPATLRAYQSRGETDLPDPQATVGGRNLWSRPVAQDWLSHRGRSFDAVKATMDTPVTAASFTSTLSRGQADIWQRLTGIIFDTLWQPEHRKNWVLRRRNKDAVKRVADEAAWWITSDLDHIVPTDALAFTIRYAILGEIRDQTARYDLEKDPDAVPLVALPIKIARMLDWMILHHPTTAGSMITTIIGQAEREVHLPRATTIQSLRTALSLDGKLERGGYDEFFARALPPEHEDE